MLQRTDSSYLSQIEEETGVLASFGEVGEKDCDADEEHRRILAHLPQRLEKKKISNTHLSMMKQNNKLQREIDREETQNSWLTLTVF